MRREIPKFATHVEDPNWDFHKEEIRHEVYGSREP
jgi:hypothetical protein